MKRGIIRLCVWRRPPLIPFPSTYTHTYNRGTPGGFSKATAGPSPGICAGVLRQGLTLRVRNEKAGDQDVEKAANRQTTGCCRSGSG